MELIELLASDAKVTSYRGGYRRIDFDIQTNNILVSTQTALQQQNPTEDKVVETHRALLLKLSVSTKLLGESPPSFCNHLMAIMQEAPQNKRLTTMAVLKEYEQVSGPKKIKSSPDNLNNFLGASPLFSIVLGLQKYTRLRGIVLINNFGPTES